MAKTVKNSEGESEIVSTIDFTKKIHNSDKFRQAAIRFMETGSYCPYPVGSSEYFQFWQTEADRCINGYTADDGDFITGYNYFYLNYCPIQRIIHTVTQLQNGKTKVIKQRDLQFPDFYDYDYYFFQAVQAAEDSSKHLCALKSRRKGYSYKNAAMACRNYYLIPGSKTYVYASNKQYLTEDGILTKAWDYMDFVDKNTAWGKKRSVNTQMRKRAGFFSKDEYGNEVEMGYKSEIIGVTLKDNPDVGHPYDQIVYTPDGATTWENISVGDTLFDSKGGITKVREVHELGETDVYELTLSDGRTVQATNDHNWRVFRYRHKQKSWNGSHELKEIREIKLTTKQIYELTQNKSYKTNKCRIKVRPSIQFVEQDVPIDAYTLGLLLGDGCVKKSTNSSVPFTQLSEDMENIRKYIPYEVRKGNSKRNIDFYIEIPNAKQKFTELNLINTVAGNKFVPDIYKYNSAQVRIEVINGLLDTDGSVTKDCGVIEYASKSLQLAKDMCWLLRSVGINCSLHSKIIKGKTYYRVYIYCRGDEQRLFHLQRKKERIAIKKLTPFALNKAEYTYVEAVKYIGKKNSKCVTVDSEDEVYLIDEFIETKNCRGKAGKLIIFEESGSFAELGAAWQIARPSVEQDGVAFGLMIAFGTGGDTDSHFETLKDMFYNPDGYNCVGFDNIWDEGSATKKCGFFIPQYTNLDFRDADGNRIYMDNDGNTISRKAMEYILEERRKVIENATNSTAVDRYVAEHCITPQEACLEFGGNIFPKKELQQRLAEIRTSETLSNAKQVGDLIWQSNGDLTWSIKKKGDITHYPLKKDDDPTGSIVIWEHPNKDASAGAYILSLDSYDYDQSGTNSLGSCFVYKRFQNLEEGSEYLVAEYTGRPQTAEEFYENVRKLAVYYNGKIMYENQNKGIFAYFVNKHCDYLLADQPDIISDVVGTSKVQRKKGCHMNKQIKQWGEGLIKDWLNDINPNGKKNLYNILSEPLLEELIAYNDHGNFDRVMSIIQLMIYREQLYNMVVKEKVKENKDRLLFDGPIFSQSWFNDDYSNSVVDTDVFTFT